MPTAPDTTLEKPKTDATTQPKPGDKPVAPGAAATSFLERQAGLATKKKPDEPKAKVEPGTTVPEKPKEGDKPKEAPKPKEEKPKVEKPKPVIVPPEPALNAEGIAAAAARGVTEAFSKRKDEEKPKAPAFTDGLSAKEQKRYEVLTRMEKDFGDAYAGRAKQFVEATKKAKDYQAKWETANPGKEFDPEDEEHNDFFAKNDVDWDDDDYNETLANIAAEKLVSKVSEKENKKLAALEQKDREREEEPKILAKKRTVAKSFFSALGDDFKDVISEDGKVNNSEVKRLVEADPIRAAIFEAAESVEAFTGELYRLTNGLAEFKDGNPSHKFIGEFWEKQEILLKNLPSDEQLDDRGRRFVTSDEWTAMTPAKRLYYWKLEPDDLSVMYAAHEARLAQERVKAEEKRIEQFANSRGWQKKPAEQPSKTAPPAKPPEAATPVVEKPNSPSGAIAPNPALPPVKHGPNGESKTKDFTSRWLG